MKCHCEERSDEAILVCLSGIPEPTGISRQVRGRVCTHTSRAGTYIFVSMLRGRDGFNVIKTFSRPNWILLIMELPNFFLMHRH
jgi:hypothetical protein